MAHNDQQMPQVPEDSEMYEAFGQMSSLWEMFQKSPEDESAHKRHRKGAQPPKRPGADQAIRLMQAMGSLLLKLDAEQQLMKRQDSWICFMQTDAQAVLPLMMEQAQTWKKQQLDKPTAETVMPNSVPLRCHLLLHLTKTLQDRMHRLMNSAADSQMMLTAKKHGLLSAEGTFPFQRWNAQLRKLQITTQPPISPSRMAKYLEQLQELVQDPSAVVKFQSLKPAETAGVVPWLLQISLRQDDLQQLMTILQGNTIWNMIGMQVKPHSLHHSRQALVLQDLMGKGRGKSSTKGTAPKS